MTSSGGTMPLGFAPPLGGRIGKRGRRRYPSRMTTPPSTAFTPTATTRTATLQATSNLGTHRPVRQVGGAGALAAMAGVLFTRFAKRRSSTTTVSTTTNDSQDDTNTSKEQEQEPRQNMRLPVVCIASWFVTMSCFLIANVRLGPGPADSSLLSSHRDVWRLVHAISSMLFGVTIFVSTVIEWLVVSSKSIPVVRFWFQKVSALDKAIVLPALTGSIISGVAQANQDYGSLKQSPKYIVGSLHTLLTFEIWWVSTDVTTQHSAREAVAKWAANDDDDTNGALENKGLPRVLLKRRWSNVGSCLFVGSLYVLMALKPGH